MKKLLTCITVVLALTAGTLIYCGGKLIIVYHDYRHGSFILIAGMGAGLLYGGCFFLNMLIRKKQ